MDYYQRYRIAAKEKFLYRGYLEMSGNRTPIEDTYTRATSASQARRNVLARGGRGAKKIKDYESYDLNVMFFREPEDPPEDPPEAEQGIEQTDTNKKEENNRPVQLDFFNKLNE